jgi:hypothetical protein
MCFSSFDLPVELSTVDLLSIFLMCERRRGTRSPWYSYLDILPPKHFTPIHWTDSTLSLLPSDVKLEALRQSSLVSDRFSQLCGLFHRIEPLFGGQLFGAFSLDEYRWAWTTVNTRCLHMPGSRCSVTDQTSSGIVLAPFLDFFNHSPSVEVSYLCLIFDIGIVLYFFLNMNLYSRWMPKSGELETQRARTMR